MTIICVKDGVIAADGACWYGGVKAELSKLKIVRSHDGALGGSVGDASYTEFFRVWFAGTSAREERGHYRPKDDPLVIGGDEKREFRAMWIEPDGDVIVMEKDGRPYLVGRELHAIGAAQEMAMGAMYAGASAEQAVRICVERSDAAGGEVFVERLAPAEESAVDQPSVVQMKERRPDLFDDAGKPVPGAQEAYAEWLSTVAPAGETVAWDQTERDARAAAQKANEEWRERMGLA